jgi:hypothetical protein
MDQLVKPVYEKERGKGMCRKGVREPERKEEGGRRKEGGGRRKEEGGGGRRGLPPFSSCLHARTCKSDSMAFDTSSLVGIPFTWLQMLGEPKEEKRRGRRGRREEIGLGYPKEERRREEKKQKTKKSK